MIMRNGYEAARPPEERSRLWLIAAIIAARRSHSGPMHGRGSTKRDRLAEMLGEGANRGWTAFGPTNIAVH